jgi:LysR family transcriptional activator of dmlA
MTAMPSPLARHSETVRGMAAMVAVADHGSLAAAAQALALTPSAVSKLVSRLEARLGARLLQRSTRRVALTEAGHAYCERARRLLAGREAGGRDLQDRDPAPRGTLRVTAPSALGQVRVVPLVLAFQRLHPALKVQLELTDRMVDLVEERIDVAIRITAAPPPALIARKLDDDVRLLCASPVYLHRHPAPRDPAGLASHACLVQTVGGVIAPWPLRERADARKVRDVAVDGPLATSSTLALRDAALAGLGIADLPRYLVDDDVAAGRLVSVLDDHVAIRRAVYLVYAPAPFTPARIRAFAEHMRGGYRPARRGAA